MPTDNHTKSKKAYLVSLKHKLKGHLLLQSVSTNQVDRRWLNGFMAAGFHSGLTSLSDLKLEYMKAHRNAYGERMTEAQEIPSSPDSLRSIHGYLEASLVALSKSCGKSLIPEFSSIILLSSS